MRIAIALVICLDLIIRVTDLEVFYADNGIVPFELIKSSFWDYYRFSFHLWNGTFFYQSFLFCLSALFALFLLIGYKTRTFTFLSWLMLISLHNRNPIILQGGDDLLRMILFWGIFLPWGKHFSVDGYQNKLANNPVNFVSIAGVAYILQICYVYGFSALQKGAEWNQHFTAMYYVYHLEQINYDLAIFLSQFPQILKILTILAYLFELMVSILILSPFRTPTVRNIGVISICMFHLWNGLSLQIGLFFIIGIASSFGLLSGNATQKIQILFKKPITQSKIILAFLSQKLPNSKLPIAITNLKARAFYEAAINYFILGIMLFVLAWNCSNLYYIPYGFNKQMKNMAYFFRFDQNWGMFAPGVIKDDGWYIYEAVTIDGDTIDIKESGKKVNYTKPLRLVDNYKNDRWRKYGEQFMLSRNGHIRKYLCTYQLNDWNINHPQKKIRQLRILYMLEFTLPDYKISTPKKEVLFQCY